MHNNNINTLRFLGAFLVLFGHTFALCAGKGAGGMDPVSAWLKAYTAYQAKLPGIGVAMFFVLSGYLVTRSFENRHNLVAYVEARILRIYPALWITLIFTVFVLGPAVTSLDIKEYFSDPGTWNYLTHNAWLYPNIVYSLPGVFEQNPWTGGVNGSLWTLPVEMRMYAIVALLGVIGFLRNTEIFNLVSLLIVGWFMLLPEQFYLLQTLKHERLGIYFLIGALFYINRERIHYHWLGLLVLGIPMYLSFQTPTYNLAFTVWFSYLVLYLSFHRTIKLPDLAKHGDFSYGLYLYAFPMTQLNILLFGPDNPWLIVLLVFISSILLAIASWYLVEKPCLRLKGVHRRLAFFRSPSTLESMTQSRDKKPS